MAALQGFELQPKGQGIAMVRGQECVRLSDLGSFARMKKFESRFAEPFSSYRPPQLVDGIDIVKALAGMGMAAREDVAAAVKNAIRQREERPQTLRGLIAKVIRASFSRQQAGADSDRSR